MFVFVDNKQPTSFNNLPFTLSRLFLNYPVLFCTVFITFETFLTLKNPDHPMIIEKKINPVAKMMVQTLLSLK